MANLTRAGFFAALAGVALAAVAGRWWIALGCAAAAVVALVAFLAATREQIIPLRRMFYPVSLTRAGQALAFFSVLLLLSAVQSAANLLFLVISAMWAAIVLSAVYSGVALRKIRVGLLVPPWAFAGEPSTALVTAASGKRLLPVTGLRVSAQIAPVGRADASVPLVPPGGGARVEFAFTPARRGIATTARVEVSTAGLLGLTRRRRRMTIAADTIVYPAPAGTGEFAASARERERGAAAVAREGEFAGLREWRPGDNPRHIHWRSSARIGRLLAKEFIRTDRPEVMILLDTFGEEGAAFEAAVSRAAGVAISAAKAGYRVTLAYFDAAVRVVGEEPSPGLPHRILKALAVVGPQRACTLNDLASRAGASETPLVSVVRVAIDAAADAPAAWEAAHA